MSVWMVAQLKLGCCLADSGTWAFFTLPKQQQQKKWEEEEENEEEKEEKKQMHTPFKAGHVLNPPVPSTAGAGGSSQLELLL